MDGLGNGSVDGSIDGSADGSADGAVGGHTRRNDELSAYRATDVEQPASHRHRRSPIDTECSQPGRDAEGVGDVPSQPSGRYAHSDHVADLEERRSMIALSMINGLGPRRIRKLINRFGSATSTLAASPAEVELIPGIGRECARSIWTCNVDTAVDRQIEIADAVGAYIVCENDIRYPPLLRQIYLPPPFLWVRGQLPAGSDFVAMVGTRRPTDYGRQITVRLSADLVLHGLSIVSGLAYGIDKEAHQAALDANGTTVAVLGSGVDRIYPGIHGRLAKQIEENGALISEFPMGAKPDASNFPQRNRIISGMSVGTVVVEAYEKGGALITGQFALEQNREVFAVPGQATSEASRGTNMLIRDGAAKLVLSAHDILSELGRVNRPEGEDPSLPKLDPPEESVVKAIGTAILPLETLIVAAGLPLGSLLSALLHLELAGIIRQYPGKMFGLR